MSPSEKAAVQAVQRARVAAHHPEMSLEHQLQAVADIRLRVRTDGQIQDAAVGRPSDIGRDADSLIGASLHEALASLVPDIGLQLERAAESGETQSFSFVSADRQRWLSAKLAMAPGGDLLLAARDVTAEYSLQVQLEHRANHDALTGLANRLRFNEELDHLLTDHPGIGAVLMIDLDEFKLVNDVAGHSAGDEVLIQLAERLRDDVRATDFPARLGGDEFAVLLRDCTSSDSAMAAARHLHETLRQPFTLAGEVVVQGCSIGVTVIGRNDSASDVLGRADVALYSAKNQGRDAIAVFDHDLFEVMKQRHGLVQELERAIANNTIAVAHQPIVDLDTGAMCAIESLARWSDEKGEPVAPAVFVGAAEEHGLVGPLFERVLHRALTDAAPWFERRPELKLHVNVSAVQMRQPGLTATIADLLAETGCRTDNLTVEITESVLALDLLVTRNNFEELRDLGIDICLDDFGTGYSSLSYLQRFAPSSLKLDRSFVDEMAKTGDYRLAGAILGLARELGLDAVAEGIETETQWVVLRSLGWKLGQGFYMSRPVSGAALGELLDEHLLPGHP